MAHLKFVLRATKEWYTSVPKPSKELKKKKNKPETKYLNEVCFNFSNIPKIISVDKIKNKKDL